MKNGVKIFLGLVLLMGAFQLQAAVMTSEIPWVQIQPDMGKKGIRIRPEGSEEYRISAARLADPLDDGASIVAKRGDTLKSVQIGNAMMRVAVSDDPANFVIVNLLEVPPLTMLIARLDLEGKVYLVQQKLSQGEYDALLAAAH